MKLVASALQITATAPVLASTQNRLMCCNLPVATESTHFGS